MMMNKLIFALPIICVVSSAFADDDHSRYTCHALNVSTPPVPQWGEESVQKELESLIKERKECPERLIDVVAYRGKPSTEYRLTLRDMNSLMRKNYADMIEKIGRNIYPVIIAQDAEPGFEGVGTSYTLYLEDGTMKHMSPAPAEYEILKDLGHMALGLFSIISHYFYTPQSTGWHDKLGEYQKIVRQSIDAASSSGMKNHTTLICASQPFSSDDQLLMLSLVDEYISECFDKKSVDFHGYQNFTAKFTPYVQRAMSCAAEIQVNASIPALEQWKKELGPETWREVYVLIPVIWPVARRNVRQQIFEELMDDDRKRTHILKTENVKSVDEARTLMGRIVGDRTLAQLVFGMKEADKMDPNLALSTRRDLVSTQGDLAIDKYNNNHPAPNELAPNHSG